MPGIGLGAGHIVVNKADSYPWEAYILVQSDRKHVNR